MQLNMGDSVSNFVSFLWVTESRNKAQLLMDNELI